MKKLGYNLIQVIIIIIITAIISGITVGVIFMNSSRVDSNSKYKKLLEDDNIKEFLKVYSKLTDDYYEDVDKDELIKNAIASMTDSLNDDYTTYLDENITNSLNKQLNSKYEGIGITLNKNKIVNVVKQSPAEKEGIEVGDIINKINDNDITNATTDEINEIMNNLESPISINIIKNGEEKNFLVNKELVTYPNSEYYMIENTTIGYLKINLFANQISEEISLALNYFEKENYSSLILDLRNNSGGYLDETEMIAQKFIKKDAILYYIENKNETIPVKDTTDDKINKPIIILINGQTASASEILASSLKYNNNAIIVGENSYGKGKVQHVYKLSTGSTVKYTSSLWLTANHECIDKVGISPDYVIENEYILKDQNSTVIDQIIDKQLELGIKLLTK